MKRKILSACTLVLLLGLFVVSSVSAASAAVTLASDESSVTSSSVSGTSAYNYGYNTVGSAHKVYMYTWYSTGAIWTNVNSVTISQGSSVTIPRIYKTDLGLWRVELNPVGIGTTGCWANAAIYN
ncbi:MAG: hypothetical protein ACC608_10085 [Anaerofustis sp.]